MLNAIDLLNDNHILVISVPLAEALGVPKSVILRRIEMWCNLNERAKKEKLETHYHHGLWWMYNTLDEWVEDIPIYSKRTIQQHLLELEELNLIHVDHFNRFTIDQTKWYTVNRPAFVAFIHLWHGHNKPVRNGGKPSDEYQKFIAEWETLAGNFVLQISGHDAEVAPSIAQELRPLDDAEVAPPIPDNTEDTIINTASTDESVATQDNRYTRNRITVVGTTEESSDPSSVDVSTLPAYMQLLLQTTRSKWQNLSTAMKAKAHAAMKAWDDDTAGYIDTKSPVEMYDTHAVYAAWVREIIVPEMQKQTGNRVNKGKFIEQTSNYIRFQKWLKSEHGKAFAQQVKVESTAINKPIETTTLDLGDYIR